MAYNETELQLRNIIFYNDRKAIKNNFFSYDLNTLRKRVDRYIDSLINVAYDGKLVNLIDNEDLFVCTEQPLDLAIAKIVNSPFLIRSFTPLYEYVSEKIKPYKEVSEDFFAFIEAQVSFGPLETKYLDVDEILFSRLFDEERLIKNPGFGGLLTRTAKRCYENLVVVRYDQSLKSYVCAKNSHILYAHKVLTHLEDFRDRLAPDLYSEIAPFSGLPFYRKLRCDEGFKRSYRIQKVKLDDISFYTMEDIYYFYIFEHPEIFATLTKNIIEKGFYPIDVNGYLREDGKLIAPYKGVYQILALKAIERPEVIERVFPEIAAMILSYPDRKIRERFSFSYNAVPDDSLANENLIKVAGVLSTIGDIVERADVEAVTVEEDDLGDDEKDAEVEESVEHSPLLDTAEMALPVENDVVDRKLDVVKYGRTSLTLDEIEKIDYRPFFADGIEIHLRREIMDFLTMKEQFPVLKATPAASGYYRVNPIDNKFLFIKYVHLHPEVIREADPQLFGEIATAKQFYDVKKALRANVEVAPEEKSKKGNIFHNLTDGQLDRSLLKKSYEHLSDAEAVEQSVIIDKDILARFNPVKDPVIFYRTTRSFLECLLHLYYLHLNEENIYHDNGKWTGKFKPLSAWVTMYGYIEKNLDCADQVFPSQVWQALNDCLRMDVVFVLNNITHVSGSAASYADECRDYLWKSASLETLVVYILEHFRSAK